MVMNKLQWAVIILGLIAIIDYLFYGTNTLFYISFVGAIIAFIYIAFKQRYCAKCGTKLPRVRKPTNASRTLFGGWTCPKCGSNLDSSGNIAKKKNN